MSDNYNEMSINDLDNLIEKLRDIRSEKFRQQFKVVELCNWGGNCIKTEITKNMALNVVGVEILDLLV